jgi:hypothetical protein
MTKGAWVRQRPEYEKELEERLRVVTDRLDAMTALLGDALVRLEPVEHTDQNIASICAEIRFALSRGH